MLLIVLANAAVLEAARQDGRRGQGRWPEWAWSNVRFQVKSALVDGCGIGLDSGRRAGESASSIG